jgi:Tfp pilus assembly PilM family ATPase
MTELHLVQLQMDDDQRIRLRAQITLPYPRSRELMMSTPKLLRTLVQSALRSQPFKGRRVVSTLPADGTTIMPVTYKVNPGQSDDQAVAQVMTERIGSDINEYVLDYLPVRTEQRSDERLAIVAMAKRETVIEYLEILRLAGVVIERLEIGPVAIRRLIAAMGPEDKHENAIAINFGRQTSFLTVISGRRLLLDQTIAFGEDRFLADIVDALELPLETVQELVTTCVFFPAAESEAAPDVDINTSRTLQSIVKPRLMQLAEELNRTLIYMASQTRGEAVNCIYLLGSMARWRGIGQLLNTMVQVSVQTVPSPMKVFSAQIPESEQCPASPETAVATGLALGGLIDNA